MAGFPGKYADIQSSSPSANYSKCECAEAENGVIINVKTGQPFTCADPCVEYGPKLAYNKKAAAKARKAVKNFLITARKP